MERAPGTLSHQQSREAEELQAAGVGRKGRWASAGAAVMSMQKEQALTSNTSRSHFPRSLLPLCSHFAPQTATLQCIGHADLMST